MLAEGIADTYVISSRFIHSFLYMAVLSLHCMCVFQSVIVYCYSTSSLFVELSQLCCAVPDYNVTVCGGVVESVCLLCNHTQ